MKRILALIWFISWMSYAGFSGEIGNAKARLVAKNFCNERLNIIRPTSYENIIITEEFIITSEGHPLLHVYNIKPAGFVIVSARSNAYPVIGYSFSSSWSDSNKPPGLKYWLEGIEYQLKSALNNSIAANEKIRMAWERYSNENFVTNYTLDKIDDVQPLITSTWNQDFPYNAMCPVDSSLTGSLYYHVSTGCAPTAIAMIMNYWRHPEQGEGYWCINPEPVYGPQCADFSNTTYNWNGMVGNPTKECNAVAQLLWHAGIGVNVSYTPTGSGTAQYIIPYALQNYFRYSSSCFSAVRSVYTYEEWVNLLKDNLDHGKPVQYRGEGNIGGHAWVCDGYQGEDFFHMNWGWGGDYNGYFYLDNLVTGSWYWSDNQMATVNIEPDSTIYPTFCNGHTDLTSFNFGSIEDGSGPVKYYQNNASCSWLIAPEDSIENIGLSFVRFSLLQGDSLNVYDGNSSNADLIASLSGDTLPPVLQSTGPAMYITFTTDATGNSQGFLVEFECNTFSCCESTYTLIAPAGEFSDGSQQYQYHNNTNCKWLITPTGAESVCLGFSSFNTEEINDKVQIYDMVSGELLAEYTGEHSPPPSPVISESGQMMVSWTTNKLVRGSGWNAWYTVHVGEDEWDSQEPKYGVRMMPNPFTTSATIYFKLLNHENVEVLIINQIGRTVDSFSYWGKQGTNQITWNAQELTPGVYICILKSNHIHNCIKFVKVN